MDDLFFFVLYGLFATAVLAFVWFNIDPLLKRLIPNGTTVNRASATIFFAGVAFVAVVAFVYYVFKLPAFLIILALVLGVGLTIKTLYELAQYSEKPSPPVVEPPASPVAPDLRSVEEKIDELLKQNRR